MKRRILIVPESAYNKILEALEYVIENAGQADYDGDHNEADALCFQNALQEVGGSPKRDVKLDRAAILNVLHAACENSCSCINIINGHAVDCFVKTQRSKIDRVMAVADLLTRRSSI